MLHLHDTLAGRLVPFTSREPGKVAMYVCGPTVYDVPHIGHARCALSWDVIRRYLIWRGYEVTFVSNITDVDDKIIKRAAEAGSTEPELARRFERIYWEQMDRLGVLRPTHMPHATEYMAKMVELIGELIDRGHAYVIDGEAGGVYFAVETFGDYGALPHRSRDQLLESAGARVEIDERKRSPLDFALWKAARPEEPSWESPWGRGRPGWHIECSAMSLDLLGEGFDLHGAGDDLIFPHHENERTQAEAAGHPFARHWAHSGMVVVTSDRGVEKMSKSLNNFTGLIDLLESYPDGRVLRLLVVQSHYRSQVQIGRTELEAASATVRSIDAHFRKATAATVIDHEAIPVPEIVDAFTTAMDDDFNTPVAVAIAFDAMRQANRAIDDGASTAASLVATVRSLFAALGIDSRSNDVSEPGDSAVIDTLVERRNEARRRKDFAEGDRIRDELAAMGITLEDTPSGTIWHR